MAEGIDEPLDSSISRKDEYRVKMGQDFMLPVFYNALLSMKVGEESKFLSRPEYYYGKIGCEPRIPKSKFLFYLYKWFQLSDFVLTCVDVCI